MFILALLLNPSGTRVSLNPLTALAPSDLSLLRLGATGTIPIDRLHRWWSLLTANYLHGGILHIVFNMMAFRQLAPFVIREYGPYRMISLFTLSGVGGFLVSYLAGVALTIGASAAVCGLIGAALFYGKKPRRPPMVRRFTNRSAGGLWGFLSSVCWFRESTTGDMAGVS